MNSDELYDRYDGNIPYEARMEALHGSYEAYCNAFLTIAARNFTKRCLTLVRAIASWRMAFRYDDETRAMMLKRLAWALAQSRLSALSASSAFSKTAVTAAPDKIA